MNPYIMPIESNLEDVYISDAWQLVDNNNKIKIKYYIAEIPSLGSQWTDGSSG